MLLFAGRWFLRWKSVYPQEAEEVVQTPLREAKQNIEKQNDHNQTLRHDAAASVIKADIEAAVSC